MCKTNRLSHALEKLRRSLVLASASQLSMYSMIRFWLGNGELIFPAGKSTSEAQKADTSRWTPIVYFRCIVVYSYIYIYIVYVYIVHSHLHPGFCWSQSVEKLLNLSLKESAPRANPALPRLQQDMSHDKYPYPISFCILWLMIINSILWDNDN